MDAAPAAVKAPAAKAPVKKTLKKKAAPKVSKPMSHPKYADMVKKAVSDLKERGGSSRQAILKYICANFTVDADLAKNHLKLSLRAGVKNGSLKQAKGTGASGSFRLGDKTEKKPKATTAKKAAKPKAAKPKAKKVKKPKTAAVKKSPKKSPKKVVKAKKPVAEKKAAKVAKPKAAKKAKKPKSPKKAAKAAKK